MAKFEITNPEAIKFINDLKSGVLFVPVKAWFQKYKWYVISAGVVLVLIIFLAIGKALSRRAQVPVFLPPDISTPIATVTPQAKSKYEWIHQNILDFSTDLPDPVIPPFDNAINLESDNI